MLFSYRLGLNLYVALHVDLYVNLHYIMQYHDVNMMLKRIMSKNIYVIDVLKHHHNYIISLIFTVP